MSISSSSANGAATTATVANGELANAATATGQPIGKLASASALSAAQWLCLLAIVLVALNLRPALAAIGPLLKAIQGDISLSFSAASLLTTLPVLAMGLFSFVGFRLATPLGFRTHCSGCFSGAGNGHGTAFLGT
ncbi:hypothetical protein [Alishewanella longhuensis]